MRRTIALIALLGAAAEATTMEQLFRALKKHPVTQMDRMQEQAARLEVRQVHEKLLPTITLFGNVEHYNTPTNLRPMSPAESTKLATEGKPLPFATTIERIGTKVTIPLYVRELYALGRKAEAMAMSARAKKRLKILQNEAMLLGADARWRYLEALERALRARRRSIEKVLADTRLKVQSGRAPGVAQTKMEVALERLEIARDALEAKKAQVLGTIEALTGLRPATPAPIRRRGSLQTKQLFATRPEEWLLEAKAHEIEAAKSKLYPVVGASASWTESYGQHPVLMGPHASGDHVHRGYGSYGIGFTMPIFDKSAYTGIEKARVEWMKERYHLQQTRQELTAQARVLRRTLRLQRRSRDLAARSVAKERKLLNYAKVAFDTGRMSEEEYLRYEEALLQSQSALYEAEAGYWQSLGQLAVLYGNDLEKVVR